MPSAARTFCLRSDPQELGTPVGAGVFDVGKYKTQVAHRSIGGKEGHSCSGHDAWHVTLRRGCKFQGCASTGPSDGRSVGKAVFLGFISEQLIEQEVQAPRRSVGASTAPAPDSVLLMF